MRRAELTEIAETEESNDPVFEARLSSGSYVQFLFPGNGYIRVHHIASVEQGDMKTLLNEVTSHFGMKKVEFFNVLDEEVDMAKVLEEMDERMGQDIDVPDNLDVGGSLEDRLRGFRRIEVDVGQQELVVLRGMWLSDKYQK